VVDAPSLSLPRSSSSSRPRASASRLPIWPLVAFGD
jgi:hypothetical protein